MLVASDTSPISNLAIIGRLDLLRKQFHEIWIPDAVRAELEGVSHPSANATIQRAHADGWLKPRDIHQDHIVRFLLSDLDRGEAEAIVLGIQLPADLVLMDEREGRGAATRIGLRVTGVLGVLMRAKQDGEILELKRVIDVLRTKAGFYVSSRLEQEVLKSSGE